MPNCYSYHYSHLMVPKNNFQFILCKMIHLHQLKREICERSSHMTPFSWWWWASCQHSQAGGQTCLATMDRHEASSALPATSKKCWIQECMLWVCMLWTMPSHTFQILEQHEAKFTGLLFRAATGILQHHLSMMVPSANCSQTQDKRDISYLKDVMALNKVNLCASV